MMELFILIGAILISAYILSWGSHIALVARLMPEQDDKKKRIKLELYTWGLFAFGLATTAVPIFVMLGGI